MRAGTLCFVLYGFFVSCFGLLEPMKDSSGEPNVEIVVDHVALLEQKLQDLTNRYETTAAELASLKSQQTGSSSGGQISGAKEIYFEVQLLSNKTGVSDNTPIVFDTLMYNTGSGYQQSSGKFVAPQSGVYLFWCYGVVNDNDALQLELLKNGKVGAAGIAAHHRQYRVASVTSLLVLDKGDQVWMTKKGSASLTGNRLSSFGGVLLYQH